MRKTCMVSAVAALAVLLLAGSVETTQAYKQGGHWSGGGKSYGGKVYGGGGKFYAGPKFYGGQKFYGGPKVYGGKFYGNKFAFRHRHRFVGVGVPLAYGYGYYGYSNSCYWLRRRALDTGSGYWWNRYYACLDGGYYD